MVNHVNIIVDCLLPVALLPISIHH